MSKIFKAHFHQIFVAVINIKSFVVDNTHFKKFEIFMGEKEYKTS